MALDHLVKAVANELPRFNNQALRGFVKDDIDNSPEFPATVLREGFKLVNADLELVDYRVLSPEEMVKFELRAQSGKSSRAKVPLTVSHLRLVVYRSRFGDQYINTYLYTPYLYEDMMYFRDKRSIIKKAILEKTFARVSEKEKDGMSISPIRVNLPFNRNRTLRIQSYSSGHSFSSFLVMAKLYHGAIPNRICDTNIIHYMLAKFGFNQTLLRFGLNKDDIQFTDTIDTDTSQFEYFAGRKFDEKSNEGPGLFLKVRNILLGDDQTLMFVVNLMYVLNSVRIQTMSNVYSERDAIWKTVLGSTLNKLDDQPKARSNAESHLRSVDYFFDHITQTRFRNFGLEFDDIYDVLVYVFSNIDLFMVRHLVQDLYDSRLDVCNGILVKTFAEPMFKKIYYLATQSNINYQNVSRNLKFPPMLFRQSSNRSDDDKDYISTPEIVGDNFLLSGGLNKIRLGGRAEQRLHPSMLVVESINAIVGKQIGKTGYLNPYLPMDEYEGITKPSYTTEIDSILAYLPR